MHECDELLRQAWEGEVIGAAYFDALAAAAPADAELWDVAATLERVTGDLVAPVARARGIDIDVAALADAGSSFAASSTERPRQELVASMLEAIGGYLATYERLSPLLPPEHAWLGPELVAHEQALAHLLTSELEGRRGGDEAIVAFVARHRGAPTS